MEEGIFETEIFKYQTSTPLSEFRITNFCENRMKLKNNDEDLEM